MNIEIEHEPSSAGSLWEEIERLFWNEYLVKLNAKIRRYGTAFEGRVFFSEIRNPRRSVLLDFFYRIAYSICVITNFFRLLFRKYRLPAKSVFFFTDARLIRFAPDGAVISSIGLYKLSNGSAAEDSIPRVDRLRVLKTAWRTWSDVRRSLATSPVRRSANLGICRILDLEMARSAILAHCKSHIYMAGHFDCYVSLASHFYKQREIGNITLFQHGLIELPPFGEKYSPLECHGYVALYPESTFFLKTSFLAPNTALRVEERDEFGGALWVENVPLIVVAMQNDDYTSDIEMYSRLCQLNRVGARLIAYVHPGASNRMKRMLKNKLGRDNISIKERHRNPWAVFTRYSSIGLEYHHRGVPTGFWSKGTRVCAFLDPRVIVDESLENLWERVLARNQNGR